MGDTYWTGASDGETWDTSGNWSGGTPGAGDIAIINATSDAIVAGDFSGDLLTELRIGDGFSGTVGVALGDAGENMLKLDATSVTIDTSGRCYLDLPSTSGTLLVERTSTHAEAVRLAGTLGSIVILDARGGVLIGDTDGGYASSTLTKLEVLGGVAADIRLMESPGWGSSDVVVAEGTLTLEGTISTYTGTLKLIGGDLDIQCGNVLTGATIEMWSSAKVLDRRSLNGTISSVLIYSGLWDGSKSTANTATFTSLVLYDDATFDERCGMLSHIYTGGVTFTGKGTFYPDAGRTLTQS